MGVLLSHMSVCHVCTWYLWRPEGGVRSPGARLIDDDELSCGCWELNLCLLEDQPFALTHWAIAQAFSFNCKANVVKWSKNSPDSLPGLFLYFSDSVLLHIFTATLLSSFKKSESYRIITGFRKREAGVMTQLICLPVICVSLVTEDLAKATYRRAYLDSQFSSTVYLGGKSQSQSFEAPAHIPTSQEANKERFLLVPTSSSLSSYGALLPTDRMHCPTAVNLI